MHYRTGVTVGFPGLECIHCSGEPKCRQFFYRSADVLADSYLKINKHLLECSACPREVKRSLKDLKQEMIQEKSKGANSLTYGSLKVHMGLVWRRLHAPAPKTSTPTDIVLLEDEKEKKRKMPPPVEPHSLDDERKKKKKLPHQPIEQAPIMQQPVTELVAAEDESLITPYMYSLMQQVKPCKFSGSSGRQHCTTSDLTDGFPGLECRHCSGEPECRRYFYRSVDTLAGNYDKISSHIMECSACPREVKRSLKDLKGGVRASLSALPKGSQRDFLSTVWRRLHAPAPKASTPVLQSLDDEATGE